MRGGRWASATEAGMAIRYEDRMVVKAAGRPDVRVTMKTAAVSVKDVEDFEREVASAGGHGIICGEDCVVAQRSAVGFRLIKPGGGFVFHLANVGDDADMVVEYLRVIYGLESRRSDSSVRSGMRAGEYDELLTTGVRWVKDICRRYVDRVEVMKIARTMGEAKAAMEAGLRAVYDISLLLPREGVLSSPVGCAGHAVPGVVKAGAPPRSATASAARGYILIRGLAGSDGVKGDGGDEVRQYMCKWCTGVHASDGDVKSHIKMCGLRKVALGYAQLSTPKACALDFAQGGALLSAPMVPARESGTSAASEAVRGASTMHANVTGVRAARGYDLIKVDGVRRYECKWCGGVRARGDDIQKHLRTCSTKGAAKMKAEARVVADEAEV